MKTKYDIQIKSDNFNSLFKKAIKEIKDYGEWTTPRGFDCKEILSTKLILTNPKNCLCTLNERKLNYAYLIIEKMMYLSGIQKPEILIAYNKQMENYINKKTGLFDGAYGPRISNNNQLYYCYQQLKEDKDSRQAIITINDYTDRHKSKDIPCTISLHFMIRNNKLDLFVNMRSNDILWGLCLDIPAFCFLQEVMSSWLNVKLGNYIHFDNSLHYYKQFEDKLNFLINSKKLNNEVTPEWNLSLRETIEALKKFWKIEELIRNGQNWKKTDYKVINSYLERLEKYWLNKKIGL